MILISVIIVKFNAALFIIIVIIRMAWHPASLVNYRRLEFFRTNLVAWSFA